MRNDVQRRGIRSPVHRFDAHTNVFGVRLAIFDKHIEIAVFVENAGIQQLELESPAAALPVFIQQPFVRVSGLRILI
jgi:hypothetical protein